MKDTPARRERLQGGGLAGPARELTMSEARRDAATTAEGRRADAERSCTFE